MCEDNVFDGVYFIKLLVITFEETDLRRNFLSANLKKLKQKKLAELPLWKMLRMLTADECQFFIKVQFKLCKIITNIGEVKLTVTS